MPLTFQAIETRRAGSELVVRGRVLDGTYCGPGPIVLRTIDGVEHATHILAHEVEFPESWPAVRQLDRNTVLALRIPVLPAGVEMGTVTIVHLLGQTRRRVDMSEALTQPEFWAGYLGYLGATGDGTQWLGVPLQAENHWYRSRISRAHLNGISPYVRVALPGSRYIELEMSGSELEIPPGTVAGELCIWIGDHSGGRRVKLGEHSGHFLLPALRADEARWLAEVTRFEASNLLWLGATYIEEGDDLLPLATRLASGLPGLLPGKAGLIAGELVRRLQREDLKWVRDPQLGWVNNSTCSLRNPEFSYTDPLRNEDFAYIDQFFC